MAELFLDEIGDISPKMQVSLLRALQSKKYSQLVLQRNDVKCSDFCCNQQRHRNNKSEEDKFRTDLFYRLAKIELKLPALRERGKKEVIALINHFNKLLSNRFQKKRLLKISKEALERLSASRLQRKRQRT